MSWLAPRVAAATLSAIAGSAASADVITVDDDLVDLPTADFTSIQAAVGAAIDGDEIIVYPGTYAESIDLMDRKVLIRSLDPDDPDTVATTIVRPGTSAFAFRANGTEDLNTIVDGLTVFRAGDSFLINSGAGMTIRRCIIDDSRGDSTQAIECSNSGPVLVDRVTITGARASSGVNREAAIQILNSTGPIEILDSAVVNSQGRAVFIFRSSSISIRGCHFEGNSGTRVGTGGAMWIQESTDIDVLETTFLANDARGTAGWTNGSSGGAVAVWGSTATIARCRFYGNTAELDGTGNALARGGALSCALSSTVALSDSVFIGNSATARGAVGAAGGAVNANSASIVRVEGCTFVDNFTETDSNDPDLSTGGAISGLLDISGLGDTELEVYNSVFFRNRERRSSGNPIDHIDIEAGVINTISDNLLTGNPNFIRDPDNFNGTWDSTDDFGDLGLADTSAAINAGNNALVTSTADIEGNDRIRGSWVDQGAHESAIARYFVDQSNTPSGNGLDWNTAAATLADLPVDFFEGEVFIAEGTYTVDPSGHEMLSGTTILGGYAPGGATRNTNTHETILSGDLNGDDEPSGINRADNADRVLRAANASDITIDGVTITGGNAAGNGGGIFLNNVDNALINDAIIQENDAANRGGGIAVTASVLSVTDSVVRDNRAAGGGGLRLDGASEATFDNTDFFANASSGASGALAINEGSTATFVDSRFEMNAANGNGGVANINGSTAHFLRSVMRFNTAGNSVSGLRFINGGGGSLTNCLLNSNDAVFVGTIRLVQGGTVSIINSTIAGNHATNNSGGVSTGDGSPITVTNSILALNTVSNGSLSTQRQQVDGDVVVNYSLVEGWDGSLSGTGSFDGGPNFKNAGNGNYRITAGSDAIDAGDSNANSESTDLDGNPRVLDDTGIGDSGTGGPPVIDLGAYEFQGTTPPCAADLTGSSDPNDPTFGIPDGDADGDDFFFFLDAFSTGNLAVCDLTGSSDPNDPSFDTPDGDCDGDDFFRYLDLFAQGCP